MFENMRFTAANEKSPIAGALLRALGETGELSIASLRSLSPLSDKAQVMVDKAVVEVGLERLVFVADLLAAGLTYPLTDPLSVTQVEWESTGKTGGAQRTMSPSARGENQMPARTINRVPIYLTTDDFSLGIRTLKMSQRVGQPLDTSLIKQATRRVNEAIEDAAINGATTLDGEPLVVSGYGAPGLLNAPNANTHSLTAAAWTTAPAGTTVVTETLEMVAKLQAAKKYGPYTLYVGTVIGNALDQDYSSLNPGAQTIRERLLKLEALKAIRVADMMPAGKAALVQMTSDVVEIINGQPPTVIPWTSLDGFTLFWLVMAIMVPRVRSDYDGNSGICIGTTA
jgi:hypothetical protein